MRINRQCSTFHIAAALPAIEGTLAVANRGQVRRVFWDARLGACSEIVGAPKWL